MSAAAVIIIRVKKIFAFLRDREAVSPNTAVPQSEVPYSDRWYFKRLVSKGAVKMHGDKCYLDEKAAQEYLKGRRMRALVFIGVVLLAFCVYLLTKTIFQ